MIKKWAYLVIFFYVNIKAQNFETIKQKYQEYLYQFDQICLLDQSEQYAFMPQFFKSINLAHRAMVQQLQVDISWIKRNIRQCKKKKVQQQEYCCDLITWSNKIKLLCNFLKKHRILYETVYFEQQVWNRFNILFQAVRNGSDIACMLSEFNIKQSGRDGLKILLKSVVKDLAIIEHDERRLHADWIDAKLSNYVLKIELIRLRNAILFHPMYKRNHFIFVSNYPR